MEETTIESKDMSCGMQQLIQYSTVQYRDVPGTFQKVAQVVCTNEKHKVTNSSDASNIFFIL